MAETFPNDTPQQRAFREFAAMVVGEDSAINLALAALLIAKLQYPDLDIAHYMAQLDSLADRVRDLLRLPGTGASSPILQG